MAPDSVRRQQRFQFLPLGIGQIAGIRFSAHGARLTVATSSPQERQPRTFHPLSHTLLESRAIPLTRAARNASYVPEIVVNARSGEDEQAVWKLGSGKPTQWRGRRAFVCESMVGAEGCRRGEIRSVRLGQGIIIPAQALEAFLTDAGNEDADASTY